METIFLYAFYFFLAFVQVLSGLISVRQKNKIRWRVFAVSMFLYYLPVYYFFIKNYITQADQTGFVNLGLLVFALFGLVMPITQLAFSIFIFLKNKNRKNKNLLSS